MNRREFLTWSASALAAVTAGGCAGGRPVQTTTGAENKARITQYFLTIAAGFLRNARATSPEYTVCDVPGGKKLTGCCTPSGHTFTSVARMLPALAEFALAGERQQVEGVTVDEVLLSIFRSAFNPTHPHYWGEPTGNKPTQRTVESSLVAIALARLGPDFAAKLTPGQRAQINRWLASCTVVPERTNNHAWFTAVNQAARLKLGRVFPEFRGDESWMFDDLRAMEVLAANAADGWYSDDPKLTVYDYYNFWTFGNFPLFWSRIAGDLYPDWNLKLRNRAQEFLERTPCFFGADGAVPLFGRSLLYRWSLLSPLLLGYEQGLWPHSPGLLRRILRQHLAWWWQMGAYDAPAGKLRDRLSPAGSAGVLENYIDGGHPYWAMLAFTFFSIPATDPLWTAPEEKLPVEKGDYLIKIPGPKMLLVGTKSSGQVRWLQALNTPRRDYYRDKYNKFVWSSSFPFNVLAGDSDRAPWDQALVLRDVATGACAARIFPEQGELLEDGVQTTWSTHINQRAVRVVSTIRVAGEFEYRVHQLTFLAAGEARAGETQPLIETLEGSCALGLEEGEEAEPQAGVDWLALRSPRTGKLLVSWNVVGYESLSHLKEFGSKDHTHVNLVYPQMAIISLNTKISIASTSSLMLISLHYASPKPLPMHAIQTRARELLRHWRAS